MASPQLGPSSISSWVKSVVAPSGLTRHEAGDGSCNRETRVVLGFLLIPCFQYQLANLSALLQRYQYIPTLRPRTTESSVVDDNMRYMPPGYRGQSHFIMHRFRLIRYVRNTMYQVRYQIKDELSDIKRKSLEWRKITIRSRIQGCNTFHPVQRKNYDLYCSCVCCSSQHHTNAKTKLSNRAGLSFFYCTYRA